jgi:hypothetical protein
MSIPTTLILLCEVWAMAVLLGFAAAEQHQLLARQEHGRTIPLGDKDDRPFSGWLHGSVRAIAGE